MFGVRPRHLSPLALKIEAQTKRSAPEPVRLKPNVVQVPPMPPEPPKVLRGPMKNVPQIIREVAEKHGVSVWEIYSHNSTAKVSKARFEAVWRFYSETTRPLMYIGNLMHRDHSSIMHAVERYMQANGITEHPKHRQTRKLRVAGGANYANWKAKMNGG